MKTKLYHFPPSPNIHTIKWFLSSVNKIMKHFERKASQTFFRIKTVNTLMVLIWDYPSSKAFDCQQKNEIHTLDKCYSHMEY